MRTGISGRTALVTGAAGGIGAAVAAMLAEEGVSVAVVDLNETAAQETAARVSHGGVHAIGIGADITDRDQVTAAFDTAQAALGSIDILVNNAGFTRDHRIVRMDDAAWDDVVDVVLKGAFLCSRAALPSMIEHGWGRIVNMSSRAYLGNPGQANYSAAKAGLLGFTRALALENGKHGVTVNAVAPGIIDTAAVRNLRHYETVKKNAEATLPLPRLGNVEDVAAAVTFLSSDLANYITGDVLHVTGGRY